MPYGPFQTLTPAQLARQHAQFLQWRAQQVAQQAAYTQQWGAWQMPTPQQWQAMPLAEKQARYAQQQWHGPAYNLIPQRAQLEQWRQMVQQLRDQVWAQQALQQAQQAQLVADHWQVPTSQQLAAMSPGDKQAQADTWQQFTYQQKQAKLQAMTLQQQRDWWAFYAPYHAQFVRNRGWYTH